MKKCPPGVFCIENVSMVFIFLLIGFVSYMIYNYVKKPIIINNNNQDKLDMNGNDGYGFGYSFLPSWPYNNLPTENVLLNPYDPPLKDDRYFVPELVKKVPINVQTSVGAVDTNYRQLGILTPMNGPSADNILPLMGRPLFTTRQKWQYYTISNQHNNVKLPILVKNRRALNDNGVDELYSGDTIYVEGINSPFQVTMYEQDTIRYLPYL